MTTTHRSAPRLYQVRLKNGETWTGTEAELRRLHPNWLPYATPCEPGANRPASQTRQPVRQLDRYPPASPHRIGHHSGTHPDDAPSSSGDYDVEMEVGEDDDPQYKSHTSIRRYDLPALSTPQGTTRYELRPGVVQTKIPPRRSAALPAPSRAEEITPAPRRARRFHGHWLLFVGLGALVALSLWYGATQLAGWWQQTQWNWTYTSTFRTFSIDQVVGHNHDSKEHPSHFIVQNDHRQILIIELPAGNPTKGIIYPGPYLIGDGQDAIPVTISFQQNLQTGRLDLVLHVFDQAYTYTNDGAKFVPPTPGQ